MAMASLSPFDNQSNMAFTIHEAEHALQPLGLSIEIGEQIQKAHIDWRIAVLGRQLPIEALKDASVVMHSRDLSDNQALQSIWHCCCLGCHTGFSQCICSAIEWIVGKLLVSGTVEQWFARSGMERIQLGA